ncbi:NepR family anti-sigma factor [Jannaschia aquimarina]|uniref:Anti-sigma factor NepR domain-containing protein n=1 Tax=Jannaschia aquimarina TaxID=935700 RepID=A0A0D1EEU9_9RHOB|nr:NepR family anti-sigma factor [Jannaschia aquimarina]KIT15411.1 hypothetical protein jaqu_28450 [Jannaschia aquimarina]SNT22701.1 hypothetical protein SAMN05421775_10869 [Jannaschia aquimarina]
MSQDKKKSNLDDLIDANLRRVYDSVLKEDVPDRFSELLRQLEQGEGVDPVGSDEDGDVSDTHGGASDSDAKGV